MGTPARVTPQASDEGRGSVRAAAGPRELEALLLADLGAEMEAARADLSRLARPLRLIVPSQSLRDHLAAACVRQVSASLAGLSIQTLHGLALSVIERGENAAPRGALLFETVVRRALRADPVLAAELDPGEQAELGGPGGTGDIGALAAASTLADFLDAGFVPEQTEALLEALDEASGGSRALSRTRRLVAALERTARALSEHDIGRPSAVLARAAAALRQDPSRARARAIWIYGFSDATGLALDFLETLRDRAAARIYADELAASASVRASDSAFGVRFGERLALPPRPAPRAAQVSFACFSAPGAEAEAREVAVRLRDLLDRGTRPESIGVVARDLEPWRLALRLHFGRLAIPFSGGSSPGAPGLEERRSRALATLLQARAEMPIERWLDLSTPPAGRPSAAPAEPPLHDLSTACRALGCGRLARLAEIDLGLRLGRRPTFVLPVHGTSEAAGDEDQDGLRAAPRLERRAIARAALEDLQKRARDTLRHLSGSPARALLPQHVDHLRELVRVHLRWTDSTPGFESLARALDTLAEQVPARFELAGEEFARLVRRALDDVGGSALAGAGGGVQCLSLVEARARTFDHLFVIGLNLGSFPRTVSPDPLFSDELRRRLLPLLPDLPIKGSGRGEERFLFEQILRASPSVTLSWQSVDDDGQALAPSPLVARLLAQGSTANSQPSAGTGAPAPAEDDVPRAPPLYPRELDATSGRAYTLRPAHERAVLAALAAPSSRGARANLARFLPGALREGRASAGLAAAEVSSATELAAARIAILAEVDASPGTRPAIGPYFGFLGAAQRESDLRHADLWVTTLEKMAGCPWQAFLQRVLRIEPAPDPLAFLPAVDARLIGIAVHAFLAEIADRAHPTGGRERDLARALLRAPAPVAWPSAPDLERELLDVARRVLQEEGLVLSGLERVLIEGMRPYLETARALDEAERSEVAGVLGSEAVGSLAIESDGHTRTLSFQVDRIDATPAGLRLTDFKTGQTISDKVRPETRERHFSRAVASGTHLQAAAYALAGGADARGRYLFIAPRMNAAAREFSIEGSPNAFTTAFAQATRVLAQAWHRGSFVPRLVDAGLEKEPPACGHCEVSSACLRGDSGARRRLAAWVGAHAATELEAPTRADRARSEDASAEAAALALWSLGRRPEPEGDGADEERAEVSG